MKKLAPYLLDVVLVGLLFFVGGAIGWQLKENDTFYQRRRVDDKITYQIKNHSNLYQNDYNFGYTIGMYKCSSMIYDIK